MVSDRQAELMGKWLDRFFIPKVDGLFWNEKEAARFLLEKLEEEEQKEIQKVQVPF